MRLFLLASLGSSLALFPLVTASAESPASIIPFDQLVQPGRSVLVSVRLVTSGLSFVHRPISGERVEFFYRGRSLGRALTGGDGLAVREFTPPTPGRYVIEARLTESPRYGADPARLDVVCVSGSVPVLLVELTSVQDMGLPPSNPFGVIPPPEAMPDAAKTLAKLSSRYQLVYFVTGDEAGIPKDKDWISSRDLPPAPLMAWTLSGGQDASSGQIAERIQEFRAAGAENISGGIARSKEVAEGFERLKIRTIVMIEEGEDLDWPKTAKTSASWKEIPSKLR
jgi:hypothetical protein